MRKTDPPSGQGLRERKKRATRTSIQRAALKLFLKKGYDATTTGEIARAAEVSASTLFNYFPTKEALVTDDYDPLFIELLRSRPADEPMFTAIRRAIESGLDDILEDERDLLMARARLILQVSALRAQALLDKERSIAVLQEILTERYGRKLEPFELKVTSALICTAMEMAMEAWLESGGEADVMKLVDRALDVAELGARLEERPGRRRAK